MPLLGLFGKKSKHSSPRDDSSLSSSPASGSQSSSHPPGSSQIYPSLDSPSSQSSVKLRRPFGKKAKSDYPSNTPERNPYQQLDSLPHPSRQFPPNVAPNSESRASHFQPPSRSAMFGDPQGAVSTRSLPESRNAHAASSPSGDPPARKHSFFPWSSSKTTLPDHKAPSPGSDTAGQRLPQSDGGSFNLRSFRHVTTSAAENPPPQPTLASDLHHLRPPRSREFSPSDPSQRISVSAFREVGAARRSQAGSPSPSLTDGERGFAPPFSQRAQGRPSPPSSRPTSTASASPSQRSGAQYTSSTVTKRPSRLMQTDTSSEEESEEAEESEDDQDRSDRRPNRNRTLTQRASGSDYHVPKPRVAKSESGHGFRATGTPQSVLRQPLPISTSPQSIPSPSPLAEKSTSVYSDNAVLRRRASKSTSAVPSTNRAMDSSDRERPRRSPALPSSKPPPKRTQYVSDTDSDDSDDAPLASLVPPKRPGSAASSHSLPSTGRPASPFNTSRTNLSKPLIDINQLTTSKPSSHTNSPVVGFNEAHGFTNGQTLLSSANGRPLPPRSLTSVEPPDKNFRDPPASPPKEKLNPLVEAQAKPRPYNASATARKVPLRRSTASGASDDSRSGSASPEIVRTSPQLGTTVTNREPLSDRLRGALQWTQQPDEDSTRASASDTSLTLTETRDSSKTVKSSPPRPAPKKASTLPVQSSVVRPAPKASGSAPQVKQSSDEAETDLADLLGGSVRLISVSGEESEDPLPVPPSTQPANLSRLPRMGDSPVVVQERKPPPSFRVMSRPSLDGETSLSPKTRQRSSTLVSPAPSANVSPLPSPTRSSTSPLPVPGSANKHRHSKSMENARERNSLLIPPLPSPSKSPNLPPNKPFATRRDSPASSTGDSSSGRTPFTPQDGSEQGGSSSNASADTEGSVPRWSGGASGLGVDARGRPLKRRSVTFDEGPPSVSPPDTLAKGKGRTVVSAERVEDAEARRMDRRRGEAKAAIDLGNVINGRGPASEDFDEDDEEDVPVNQTMAGRAAMMNNLSIGDLPQMHFPTAAPPSPSWMMNPAAFMVPPPTDPAMFMAHQQAMMQAKYAYQMAVAQQAIAAAGEEWERGSAMGGYSGSSVYGGGNTGSVYGGGLSSMSMYGGGLPIPPMGWSPGLFPPSPASMFGGGVARSDYGGGGGGGGGFSSSRSVYGENFGPSPRNSRLMNPRDSVHFPSMPSSAAPMGGGMRTGGGTPRSRTSSQPATPVKGTQLPRGGPQGHRGAPPSSWRT